MTLGYWDKIYHDLAPSKPLYDNWLDKYEGMLKQSIDTPIIDLGCGKGNNALYLTERKFKVIACDQSQVAIELINTYVPQAATKVFDINKGLPFDSASAKIIIADLSLHYFSWSDTEKIISDIQRVLLPEGYLLARLNSTNDTEHFAGQGTLIEDNYYGVNGTHKRFFEKTQIDKFFKDWRIDYVEEYQLDRLSKSKILWEVCCKKQ